jgi:hypothetical protein
LVVVASAWADPYGLFGVGDRPIPVYDNERLSKYLLSYRYIPARFDALLIGPSVSANLDPALIPGLKLYNGSLDGANACELAILARNVMSRGRPSHLFIAVTPIVLRSHEMETRALQPEQLSVALGSLDLAKAVWVSIRVPRQDLRIDPKGYTKPVQASKARVEQSIERFLREHGSGQAASEYWHIDPRALECLAQVVGEAHQRSIKVVGFFPPIPAPIYQTCQARHRTFKTRALSCFGPTDTVIDFNEDQYARLRSDLDNFTDSVHLSAAGAKVVTETIGGARLEGPKRAEPGG